MIASCTSDRKHCWDASVSRQTHKSVCKSQLQRQKHFTTLNPYKGSLCGTILSWHNRTTVQCLFNGLLETCFKQVVTCSGLFTECSRLIQTGQRGDGSNPTVQIITCPHTEQAVSPHIRSEFNMAIILRWNLQIKEEVGGGYTPQVLHPTPQSEHVALGSIPPLTDTQPNQ